MSERVTRQQLETRIENLYRRMEACGSAYRYQIQARNGYIGLDRFTADPDLLARFSPASVPGRGIGWICQSTVTAGTKREVAEDDARVLS